LTGSYPNPQIAPDAVGPSETGAVPAAKVINFLSAPTGTNTIPFPGETFDFADMHSTVTNTGSLIAPIVGVYLVDASLAWSAPANPDASGSRTLTLTGEDVSNVAGDSASALPTGFTFNSASTVVSLFPGDEIHMDAGQDSGAALGVAAQFSMVWLGPVPPA
jgi:hypothetical protein